MADKTINIKERFTRELSEINYILTSLENNRVMELNGVNIDGSLGHNARKLRKEIAGLLYKIEYGKDSVSEELGNIFFGNQSK
ncbi:hypothetical protein ASG99_04470 [Bacillus sp. Soil768D1]|nr:hypothetical protein ASG99_04470 [Bacillus sp. Soil768D1]